MIQQLSTVLAVDLDHTLIKTDMILVGIKYLILHKIYLLPVLAFILFTRGKPSAKKYLYDNTEVSIKELPFNDSVIDFINENCKKYTHIILISGSYYKYVNSIADYLKIFDSSIGTSITINMISSNKTNYLKNNFDNFVFDYIGDSKKDIPIWEESRKAFVVDRKNITKYLNHINYEIIPNHD
jgi:hypothetical protein